MKESFQLRLLGPVELLRSGKSVRGFESRKAVALLGYLAARRQAISRSVLADLFWGDKPEPQGRANLSRVLHNLSSLLPHSLQTDPHTVEFQPIAGIELDLSAFDGLVQSQTPSALAQAAALYRDEFMSGIYLDDCPDFEIWLVAERERWRQRVSDVLEGLVTYYLGCSEFETAMPFATRLLELEPWREEAHRQMMLLLARSGQRSAALMQFEACRRALAEEIRVDPSPETIALAERIKRQELGAEQVSTRPALSPRPRSTRADNLPLLLDSFVGRDEQVAEIKERLDNPACRLLTLVGAAGTGKTRLAIEAARQLNSFSDGVYFIPLSPINSIQFVVPAIALALGFSFEGMEGPKEQLLNYLREKQLLLLLDNFEHLAEAAALVSEILQSAPHVKVLVTSQQRLNLHAEWLLSVEGLPFPRMDSRQPLRDYAAAQLFLERARMVDSHFSADDAVRPAIIRICQLVEGMPLGLELAAAWVGKLSCDSIAQEIERNLDFLFSSASDVPARHRSMRAAIDWSYNLLEDRDRLIMRRLAVFAGGFTVEAASAVCGLQDSHTETLTRLAALADKSLLRSQDLSQEQPRFTLLEPIHEYAYRKLTESGDRDAIQEEYANWFLSFAEAADHKLTGPDRQAWLQRLDVDYDNLRAVLGWSVAREERAPRALRLVAALIWYWYFRNFLNEGRDWVTRTLSHSNLLPSPALVRALYGAGAGAWLQGDYKTAEDCLVRSTELARQLDDRPSLAFALTLLSLVKLNQGAGAEAMKLNEESSALFRVTGDRWGLALSLSNMQLAASMQGDEAAALDAVEQAIALFRALKDHWALSLALNNLGLLAYRQGDLPAARARLEEALAIRRQVGDKWMIAQSLNYLGNAARAQGDSKAGVDRFEESLRLNRELGNKHGIAECFEGMAKLAGAQQQPERAARLFGAAEVLRQAIGAPLPVSDRPEYDHSVSTIRADGDPLAFDRARAEGQTRMMEQMIDYALQPGS